MGANPVGGDGGGRKQEALGRVLNQPPSFKEPQFNLEQTQTNVENMWGEDQHVGRAGRSPAIESILTERTLSIPPHRAYAKRCVLDHQTTPKYARGRCPSGSHMIARNPPNFRIRSETGPGGSERGVNRTTGAGYIIVG